MSDPAAILTLLANANAAADAVFAPTWLLNALYAFSQFLLVGAGFLTFLGVVAAAASWRSRNPGERKSAVTLTLGAALVAAASWFLGVAPFDAREERADAAFATAAAGTDCHAAIVAMRQGVDRKYLSAIMAKPTGRALRPAAVARGLGCTNEDFLLVFAEGGARWSEAERGLLAVAMKAGN